MNLTIEETASSSQHCPVDPQVTLFLSNVTIFTEMM